MTTFFFTSSSHFQSIITYTAVRNPLLKNTDEKQQYFFQFSDIASLASSITRGI
jgi:hypothetical protein